MKRIHKKTIFTAVFLLAGLSSCKKFLQIDSPINLIVSSSVFSDDATAEAAVIGVYGYITRSTLFLNGNSTLYPALSADEVYRTSSASNWDEYENNALSPDNSLLYSDWSEAYKAIYHANVTLENLEKSTEISSSLVQQLTGELLFLRALHYFYLVNYFGAVPLVITADYQTNASLPRTAVPEIYQQIITDLKKAQGLLKPEYTGTGKSRANLWSATALLARAYLYNGDWELAEEQATEVIEKGGYTLATSANAFLATSTETILYFTMPLTGIYNTADGNTFNPSSTLPAYALRDETLAAFEPGDLRRSNWVKGSVYNLKAYYYPYKYKIKTGTAGAVKTEHGVVLRLGEQYLIRAEARIRQNKVSDGIKDLNTLRTRSRATPTTAIPNPLPALPEELTDTEALVKVEQERRIELLAEWGHRWLDLKRTGRADAILAPIKGENWQAEDVLYPIPTQERLSNPFLYQNAGYPGAQ